MKSGRALFIIPTDHAGGAERMTCILANTLAERNWAVKFRVLARSEVPSFCEQNLSPLIDVRFGRSRSPWAGMASAALEMIKCSYDLAFTSQTYLNALMSLLAACGALQVGTLAVRESTTVFDRFEGLKRWGFRAAYRLYGAQDLIIAQTRYMAEHVAPYIPPRAQRALRVMPNPVDLDAIDRAAREPLPDDIAARLGRRPSILVCGRLIEVKQPSVAIEAFARLRERTSGDMQLVFLGDGVLRPALEAEVRARGLADDVAFLGQRANPYAIMRACQYGLLTSSREGFPNVVLEMMACGVRKVVMTPCAGDLDALTGVTVTAGFTADELASALAEAILSGEDHHETYRSVVADRSVEQYLNVILGVEADAR